MAGLVEFGFEPSHQVLDPEVRERRLPRGQETALEHEIRHDAMESGAVIESCPGQPEKIAHVIGGQLRKEFKPDAAERCFEHRSVPGSGGVWEKAGGGTGCAARRVTFCITGGFRGTPFASAAVSEILSTTSIPSATKPKAEYCPSSCACGVAQMKN